MMHSKYRMKRNKAKQRGLALIEAMVAMFLLAFGVLALMASQLQSVAMVQEAENQTIAAQAAQNLMEGMLSNPDISASGVKSYDSYKGDAAAASGTGSLAKDVLAKDQLQSFKTELNKMKNAENITSSVTESIKDGKKTYTINITWNMKTAAGGTATASGNGMTQYSYTLPVQD